MEVDCELLENYLPKEEPKIEMEEEFVINDLDEKVLELEVVGPEEVEAEEENQFALDFSLSISDAQEAPSEKIIHTLTNGEDENVKDDSCLSEAIDFEFEVVEKLEEVLFRKWRMR